MPFSQGLGGRLKLFVTGLEHGLQPHEAGLLPDDSLLPQLQVLLSPGHCHLPVEYLPEVLLVGLTVSLKHGPFGSSPGEFSFCVLLQAGVPVAEALVLDLEGCPLSSERRLCLF